MWGDERFVMTSCREGEVGVQVKFLIRGTVTFDVACIVTSGIQQKLVIAQILNWVLVWELLWRL